MKKVLRILLTVAVVFLFQGILWAQSVEELFSPLFLTNGTNAAATESPGGDILNPAASGADQRAALDLSYIHLYGAGTDAGNGMALNLGGTFPSRIGVISASTHFIHSPFTSTNLGTYWQLNGSFAKDLYSNLLVGAGLQFALGAQSSQFDWGLGLDLGFIHLAGDLGILKDFQWGFAMRGLGKGYAPSEDTRLLPRAFTPALGANFKVLNTENVDIILSPDLAFPGFSNVQFNLGAQAVLFDNFFIQGAYNFDYLELQDGDTSRFPLTFGVAFQLDATINREIDFLDISKKGWNKTELKTSLAGVPLQNDIWGIGAGINAVLGVSDKNPPEIDTGVTGEIYISPNQDGIRDDLILPLTVKDSRYVKGYRLVIEDSEGNVQRTIENKDERPENLSFENILDRLTYVKSGITIPESIRWDGKSDEGAFVPDGEYYYVLEAWDDNGNRGKSTPQKVTVDNTPPAAELEAPYLIFSPNEDGNKDILEISQKGSKEDEWNGVITTVKGEEVRHFSWEELEDFQWDGKNDEGLLVSDGVYNYQIASTDRAGNSRSFKVDNIIINTAATPISMSIDQSHFSPNDDGVKDTLRFNLEVPVTTGIENWMVSLADSRGSVVKSFSGTTEIPGFLDFDGKGDKGTVLSEGVYSAKLKILYNNGNNPEASSPSFTIDLTPPRVYVKANLSIFSPNNDGNKDEVIITQDTSEEDLWTGVIKNSLKEEVKSFTWKGTADTKLDWSGTDDQGSLLPDDTYTYVLTSTDKAGNSSFSNPLTFQLSTEETPVLITVNYKYFSPNKDGVKDEVQLSPHLSVKTGIERYELNIYNAGGTVVRSFAARKSTPSAISWDGKDNSGMMVPDGTYYGEIRLLYENGNEPVAKTMTFDVDTVFPEVEVSSSVNLFSPDKDGRLDSVQISQVTSNEDLWDGEILDAQGNIIRSFFWKGKAGDFMWDGGDANGNIVADGRYSYKVYSTDKAGNRTEKVLSSLEVDSRLTTIFITAGGDGFSPNGDDYLEDLSFTPYLSLNEGIKEWKLEMVHKEKGPQKTFSGNGAIDTSFTWDGRSDSGEIVEGNYFGRLTVEYAKGNRPVEQTNSFILDVSPPQADIVITPDLFSPDNDGLNDELYINTAVTDLSPILQWDMEILDPKGKHFTSYAGTGIPSGQIIWDGVSDKGDLVLAAEDYTLRFTILDNLGNENIITRKIPIDVLVMRIGDKLMVRVASITFAPNTANYLDVEEEKLERNMKTIQRLAEIFKKYDKYNIRIEGHAVSLNWADPAKAAVEQTEELIPLSKERADSIKNALVNEGLNPDRISTVGIGGSTPVVPHSDLENRWKNRRVEFVLIRK